MKTFRFYGAESNRFRLDDTFWEAFEDENDGYRSLLDTIEVIDKDKVDKTLLYNSPIADVYVREKETADFSGYEIIDVIDGHVWLTVGTLSDDEYYPLFVFNYTPKPNPVTITWEDFIREEEEDSIQKTTTDLLILRLG